MLPNEDNHEDKIEEKDENKSFFALLINALKELWEDFNLWMSVDPEDAWYIKVLKLLGKIIGVLIFIALSPVIAITLFIAFIIAF